MHPSLTTGGRVSPNVMRPDGLNFGLGGIRGRQTVDLTGGRQSNQAKYNNYTAALSGQPVNNGYTRVGSGPIPPIQGPMPNTGATFDNATGQPISNGGTPAWMNTPQGQQYMARLMEKTGGITAGYGNTPQTGLIGSEQALMQALSGATGTLNNGAATADGFLSDTATTYNPYIEQGGRAFGLQADLSGVNGQDAFNTAFTESPVQQFLREQGERSVTQNAAALGGLGGGNVMKELNRYGQGVASTELQQQIDNLNTITGLGFDATGNQNNINNARGELAYRNAGTIAQGIGSAGQLIAANRNQAGRDIAGSIESATSSLSNLVSDQGSGVSDIYGAGGSNLALILGGLGTQLGSSQQQMATLLANALQGQASQVSSLPALGSFVQADNSAQNIANAAGGIGSLLSAYDQFQSPQPTAATINTGQQYAGYA